MVNVNILESKKKQNFFAYENQNGEKKSAEHRR